MAVGGSFDQWQKDLFFSAAEEVQESADVMLSVYRVWLRHRQDKFNVEESDEMCRELQIALGTAKWQLDEFERAIKLSDDKCSVENTIVRHKQFITAIGNQIAEVEKALSNTLSEERKQSFRWVQLDKEERDDFADFLSGKCEYDRERQAKVIKCDVSSTQARINVDCRSMFKDKTGNYKDERCIEVFEKESSESKNVEGSMEPEQLNGLKNASPLDTDSWKIVIDDNEDTSERIIENRQDTPKRVPELYRLLRSLELIAKFKWFKNSFRKAKTEEHLPSGHGLSNYLDKRVTWITQGINGLTERSRSCYNSCTEDPKLLISQQLYGRGNGVQRNIQGSQSLMQFSRTLRVTLLLVLSIILIVPFVFTPIKGFFFHAAGQQEVNYLMLPLF